MRVHKHGANVRLLQTERRKIDQKTSMTWENLQIHGKWMENPGRKSWKKPLRIIQNAYCTVARDTERRKIDQKTGMAWGNLQNYANGWKVRGENLEKNSTGDFPLGIL
jgi:hypothetical protein